MRIYNRDYTKLTEDEVNEWEVLRQKEVVKSSGKLNFRKSMFRKYPKAVRHYLSLFPNNYLDIEDLKDEDMLKALISNFCDFLDNDNIIERDIAKFIKDEEIA